MRELCPHMCQHKYDTHGAGREENKEKKNPNANEDTHDLARYVQRMRA